MTWKQSNLFVNGTRTAPENVTVIGGKTGTTDEAGACLVLYEQDSQSRPYISIVMGAESKMHYIIQWIRYYLPYQALPVRALFYIISHFPYYQSAVKADQIQTA